MIRRIRLILTGGLVAAIGATGVTYATSGSFNPVTLVKSSQSSGQSSATGQSGPEVSQVSVTTASGPSADPAPKGTSVKTADTGTDVENQTQDPPSTDTKGGSDFQQTGNHEGQFPANEKGKSNEPPDNQNNGDGDQLQQQQESQSAGDHKG